MASRFSPSSCGGPFGTAQDASAPLTCSLKSKCNLRAACRWTTKLDSFVFPACPLGSEVFRKLRLRLYSASSVIGGEYNVRESNWLCGRGLIAAAPLIARAKSLMLKTLCQRPLLSNQGISRVFSGL